MNIRLKAGLEVAGFIVSALVISVLIRLTLDYFSGIYGREQVVQGICTLLGITFMALAVKFMYDIRVSQLEYQRKLNDMVNK